MRLRDEIARLAEDRGSTMLEVVTDAIGRLGRDEWWESVHQAVDDLDDDEIDGYRSDTGVLDAAVRDGLAGG